jgi:hypothetical protein
MLKEKEKEESEKAHRRYLAKAQDQSAKHRSFLEQQRAEIEETEAQLARFKEKMMRCIYQPVCDCLSCSREELRQKEAGGGASGLKG